ncbi:MAG: phosphatidate cytidylyltransferase [Candidatus Bipolaricaulaceae bacterium]
MKGLASRLITALVAVPFVLGVFWAAEHFHMDWLVGLLVSVVGLIAGWEYLHLVGRLEIPLPRELLLVAIPAYLMLALFWDGRYALVVGWAVVYLVVVYSFFRRGPRRGFLASLAGIFGLLYIPVLLSFVYLIYRGGFWYLVQFFLIVWGYDTGAYLVGSQLGRHQILPRISLAKTWEGVAGGLALAVVGAALCPVFWDGFLGWLPHLVVLGVWVGSFVQLGDLFESLFKRAAGVKDAGALLPGHGGVLDRIDGLLAGLPIYFFYLHFVLGQI